MTTYYSLLYLISPNTAHRLVGYIEEEAVHTYTSIIKAYDDGLLPHWRAAKPPQEAIDYYALDDDATVRDMLLAIRADEAMHRSINHHFSDIPPYYDFHDD